MEQVEAKNLELFEIKVRRLQNGNKLSVTFESAENLELEKKLIDFRGERVKVLITQSITPDDVNEVVTIDDEFELFALKTRRLRNGNKLSVTLEQIWKREEELKAVKLRYQDVNIAMLKLEGKLDFEQKARGSIDRDDEEGNELGLSESMETEDFEA